MSNITNLNRDYLIKINVKEATIDVPKMTFWNTDKKTSNMFVQLVINMSENELIKNYVTIENATDYKITLNVIKPKTNQYRTFEAKLLNEEKALFEIDLTSEFIDQVGNYNFEFEVSSKVDNNDESITTSNGTYEVKGSILTNLNQEISSSPDLPILKQLIEQVKSLQGGDLTGYQKKEDETLETTSKEVVGAINEVNSQYKDIEQQIEQGGTFPENLVLWEDDGLGEDDKEIEYTLPIATSTILGGVKPVSKTTEMTQEVGVDSDGKLYTNPSSSSSGEHTSSAISEVIANDELVNTIISSGQTSGSVFSTKLNWEQLKQYKRFAVIFKGESNMGAANTYVQIGTTKIARFGESGFYGEYNFLGANLLECYSTSGNQSMISLTPYDTVDMSYTGRLQKGQSLGDMSSVLNTDVLSVNFSSKTTINYTLKIIGLTKGV